MNKFIPLIILFLFISCSSKSQNEQDTIGDLKIAFYKNDDKLFLENFPKNYNQFVMYFGWNDNLDSAYPLYEESTQYIDRFFAIITKDKTHRTSKLFIDIGINGKYQADAVNYFKTGIEKQFNKNSNLACELLKNRKTDEVASFWHFYLDSPQPLTSIPDTFENLKNTCSQIYFSLEKQLKLIQKENLVSEITNENKTNKLKLINDFIPKGYTILDSLSGYINNDKLLDKIIILANNEEFKNNEYRLFMILINEDNKQYQLQIKSQNIIPCLKCTGGIGGEDSYSELNFENNILSFKQLKIIDSKSIIIKYVFLNNNRIFKLDKVVVTNSNLTDDRLFKNIIAINNKITIKDFNFQNYNQYLKYVAKIIDSDGFTNLRKEKNSNSIIITKIKTGDKVNVLDNSADWWLVQTIEGKKGYVYKTKLRSE